MKFSKQPIGIIPVVTLQRPALRWPTETALTQLRQENKVELQNGRRCTIRYLCQIAFLCIDVIAAFAQI